MNLLKLLIVILCNTHISLAASPVKESTTLSKPIEILSSRRKRSLLLPDHGSLKLTIGLGKALIATSPKGLSLSWELSNYYAGPTTIKDWRSEVQVPHQSMQKLSDISNSEKAAKEKYQMKSNKYQNLLNPYYAPSGTVSNANLLSPVSFERTGQNFYSGVKTKQMNRQRTTLHELDKRSDMSNGNRQSRWMNGGQSKHTSPLGEILTLVLGTNVKCGIHRSICRSKDVLLPPGYSMIQDMLRTVFFIPTRNHASEGVGINLCDRTSYCDLENEDNNSFNFLDWILNPMKID